MRAPKPYSVLWVLALIASDLAMFTLSAYLAATMAAQGWTAHLAPEHVALTTGITIAVWLFFFARLGLYRCSFALTMRDEFYYTVIALCMGVIPVLLAYTLIPAISSSRIVVLLSLLFTIITVSATRASMHILRENAERKNPHHIAIVGHPNRVKAAAESLNIVDGSHITTIEIDDLDATLAHLKSIPGSDIANIGWFHTAHAARCDRLILTEMPPPDLLPYLLEAAAHHQMELAIAPPRIRAQAYSLTLQTDGQQVLIVPKRLRACRPYARLLKRIMDLVIAFTALLIFSPVMVIAAIAIRLDSDGPILYRQERVGRDGKPFDILKFRSMRVNAEAETGPVWRSIGDNRTTRIGAFLRRTSLDELPQLFNVLKGDMSVVGPRPERPFFVERFRKHLPRYDERSLVRPGITGWAQIHLDRDSDLSMIGKKLNYDLFYIENWGLLMDLSILFKTAAEFLFQRAS